MVFGCQVRSGIWVVEVYAKWCGHCKQLEPIWRDLAKTLKTDYHNDGTNIAGHTYSDSDSDSDNDSDVPVFVARIEISKARGFANRMGIQAIPTILLFRDGRTRVFGSNERSLDNLQEFVRVGWK